MESVMATATAQQIDQIETIIKQRLGEREEAVARKERALDKVFESVELALLAIQDDKPLLVRSLKEKIKRDCGRDI